MDAPFKVGEIILGSEGSYSDYGINAILRVLKPIDEEVWKQMRLMGAIEHTRSDGSKFTYVDRDKCVAWLLAFGYAEELEYREAQIDEDWADA